MSPVIRAPGRPSKPLPRLTPRPTSVTPRVPCCSSPRRGSPPGALLLGSLAMHIATRLALLAVLLSVTFTAEVAAQGSIKIGFLSPLSGPIAAAGKDMYAGCELYWQETGWQMAGRKVEVVLEDNESNPATTLTKARKLVESDKVNMVAGVILSNVAYALVPYVEQQGIPTIYP